MLIDVIAIALILLCLIRGVKKGFIKTLFGTLSLAFALLLTGLTLSAFTIWLADTPLGEAIYEKTQINILENTEEASSSGSVYELLEKAGISSAIESTQKEASLRLGDMVMRGFSACILFLGYMLLLRLLSGVLNLAAKLPILHTFNRLGGFAAGGINAYLLLTAAAFLIPVVLSISPNDALREQFEQSIVMGWFLEVNPFL